MSKTSRALFSTPVTPVSNKHGRREDEESPSLDGSSFSESLGGGSLSQSWRPRTSAVRQRDEGPAVLALVDELQACYKLLKDERRITNDYHRRVHGSPSEWGKLVSKRMMELHPLYSPSKITDKRPRVDLAEDVPPVELDDIEALIREEVLLQLQGKQQLCACGQTIEPGDMFNAHVLPCPHCRSQKCSECTAQALEVRATSSCCEVCAMACNSCVRKLRLACSSCHLGRRCQGAGCGGIRCSTCFNQLCEDCKELDANNVPVDEEHEGTGFEYFFCPVCQFRSCQDCQRKNCYCAPATRLRVPDAIPTKVEGRSMSYLFDVLGGKGGKHARK